MDKAYTVEKYHYHMAEVERIDKRVKDHLIDIGYERWFKAHSTVNRMLTMTSNITESINAALKAARELPLMPLLEYIRQLIGRWNVTNQKNAIESFTDLGKKYDTMLMDILELSHRMECPPARHMEIKLIKANVSNIHCLHKSNIIVFKQWRVLSLLSGASGFLFLFKASWSNSILYFFEGMREVSRYVTPSTSYLYSVLDKVLKYNYIDHIEYCSVYYTWKYLLKTYEIPIYPVLDESTWKIPAKVLNEKVLPPDVTKSIGSPRKGRCKPISERERKRSISCGQY
ncbi:PREDICTED: uncharacterized protein LOC109235848 [Nicotiana attenuata]|uniref:uncharacterized protein LOC109235848 n=1 Tax=Nicotiana attenuata TaxID=49451 RepID=UPI000904EA9A|nr:PREDICTED: uncharacterized protein LOC109235848 [Nicotiana attenuata]